MTAAELEELFRAFREQCIWLRCCYNTYAALYESGEEINEVLVSSASLFFHDLNHVLIEYCLLQVCKINDPEETRGQTNLTVEHVNASLRASDLMTDEITRYIRMRQSEKPPAASASINLELSTLKRAFNLAVRAGRLHVRPYIPSIEVNNVRKGFFEANELKAVVKELPDDIRPIIRFCFLTGWRISEVLTLPWRQVDLKAGIVRLEPGTTKNDEGRTFPCSALPELEELLKEQHERTKACELETGRIIPWVFHRNGKQIKSFRAQWHRACEKARVPGRYVHDLRRTAVRNLERAGVPRSVAMKLSGHKTESVYRRYAIVSESDLAEGCQQDAGFPPHPEVNNPPPLR